MVSSSLRQGTITATRGFPSAAIGSYVYHASRMFLRFRRAHAYALGAALLVAGFWTGAGLSDNYLMQYGLFTASRGELALKLHLLVFILPATVLAAAAAQELWPGARRPRVVRPSRSGAGSPLAADRGARPSGAGPDRGDPARRAPEHADHRRRARLSVPGEAPGLGAALRGLPTSGGSRVLQQPVHREQRALVRDVLRWPPGGAGPGDAGGADGVDGPTVRRVHPVPGDGHRAADLRGARGRSDRRPSRALALLPLCVGDAALPADFHAISHPVRLCGAANRGRAQRTGLVGPGRGGAFRGGPHAAAERGAALATLRGPPRLPHTPRADPAGLGTAPPRRSYRRRRGGDISCHQSRADRQHLQDRLPRL